MDELSYDQAFGRRPSGLPLPNLSNFAQQSTTFSNLQPTGYLTEEVIPGLLLGQTVADVDRRGKPFRFRSVPRGPWQLYDPARTIFGDAQRLGWTTGIAGWYNPYCRLFQDVLGRCSWNFSEQYPGLSPQLFYERSTLQNLVALLPLRERLDKIASDPSDHAAHERDYRGVMVKAEDLLRDQRVRFVMLHLPVPHTPGIYDRHRRSLVAGGNYIDNLALADETLGQLMKVIEDTGDAPNTSIIVSSDHSWRVDIWKKLPDWTPEETQLSGGRFDPRPVLMVHFPGQLQSQTMSQPVSAMVVHSILEAMLRGQARSPSDIKDLVASQPK
jgi:hypothetical protein